MPHFTSSTHGVEMVKVTRSEYDTFTTLEFTFVLADGSEISHTAFSKDRAFGIAPLVVMQEDHK
jgi:hypothetical protein